MLSKRPLGATGSDVSVLGLGTVKFGRNTGVKYPQRFELPSDAEIETLLGVAEDEGVNLLDTAPAYGTSEERVGRALRGKRSRWVLVTKVGESFDGGVSAFDFSAGAVAASLVASLRRLESDFVDVALVHSDGVIESEAGLEDALAELAAWRTRGAVRAVGVSSKTVAGGLRAVGLSKVGLCDVVMVSLNVREPAEESLVAAARQAGVGVLVKKALASGHAADTGGLERAARFPGVSSVVVGTLNPAHLRANCAAVAGA